MTNYFLYCWMFEMCTMKAAPKPSRQLMETLQVLQSKSETATLKHYNRKRKCHWRPLEWSRVTAPQQSLAPSSYQQCRYSRWCVNGCLALTHGDVTLFYFENGKMLIGISCLSRNPMMCVGVLKVCSQLGCNIVLSTGLVQDKHCPIPD